MHAERDVASEVEVLAATMNLSLSLLVALAALVIERFAGYPAPLERAIGHPVAWIGRLIGALETRLNRPRLPAARRRATGVLALLSVLAIVAAVALPLALLLRAFAWGWVVEAVIATAFLAQKSLARHVEAVADGLDRDVAEGREAVAHLVGRDPERLDTSGVARAAIESLAENASDGIVAPALWLGLLGLPGIVLYKAVNTADSMIGHLDERYRHFGWAAARLDDLVNLPASRLTGLLIAAAAALRTRVDGRAALAVMRRDAGKHVSPNAGWPEAAMAGALAIRLGGPRSYHGRMVDLAWMGEGRADLDPSDIRRALTLQGRAMTLLALLFGLAASAFLLT
jgi:adenosylcobinamide-phosphate synthase